MSDQKNPVDNPKANEQELSQKELQDVSAGGVSLNYTKIQVEYTKQKEDGTETTQPTTNK